ncbi:MAG: hypothetical protein A2Y40_07955 [Candidatus Margulisbacteria bacterium GWF2_35_9]|nr:MAG: hypothetical protein A2Y40_07955 [Candidatus Margulisbacteria bacterium GWF2_35_9]
MEQINNQIQSNSISNSAETGDLFNEIDSLLSGLERLTEGASKNNININMNNAIISEDKVIEDEVIYKESNSFVENGTKYIESLEQDRMMKVKQKQILVKLGQDRINAAMEGKSYSRNLDEGVMLNTTKKDIKDSSLEENKLDAKTVMKKENIEDIIDVSEDLNEEFIKKDQEKNFDKKDDFTNNGIKRKKESGDKDAHEEKSNQEEKDYEIEEDEIIEIELTDDDNSFIKAFHNVSDLENIINIGEEIKKEVIKTSNERYMYNYLGNHLQQQAKIMKIQDIKNRKGNTKTQNIQKLRKRFNHGREDVVVEPIPKKYEKLEVKTNVQPLDIIQDKIIEAVETFFLQMKAFFFNLKIRTDDGSKKKNQLNELKKKINELQSELDRKEKERINEIKESKQNIKKIKKLISEVDWKK